MTGTPAQPAPEVAPAAGAGWWVYVLRCRDGTFYTGITTDPAVRLRQHNAGRGGARYTRGRRPVALHAAHPVADRPAALRLERRVKALPRAGKEALPTTPGWLDAAHLAPATSSAVATAGEAG